MYGGAACEGDALQSANCNEDPCPSKLHLLWLNYTKTTLLIKKKPCLIIIRYFVVDCEWTAFGDWSDCSKPCNSGLQSRERTVKIEAENGGENCTGLALVDRVCNVHNCAGIYTLKYFPINEFTFFWGG